MRVGWRNFVIIIFLIKRNHSILCVYIMILRGTTSDMRMERIGYVLHIGVRADDTDWSWL